ncbi:hypothetical protein [Aliiroseovarius crassostreae]|uniref:hypothetical protein n=1 Tax=Aliiroseovarius crassostreae TaxID=154981 RepID=UPI003C7CE30E
MKFATEVSLALVALLLMVLSAQFIGGNGVLIVMTLYFLTIMRRFIWEIGRHPKFQLRFPFSRNTHTR